MWEPSYIIRDQNSEGLKMATQDQNTKLFHYFTELWIMLEIQTKKYSY